MPRFQAPHSKTRRRHLIIYIVLLVAVLFAMASLRTRTQPAATTATTPGDTLRVAIIYSPLSYYTYSDTLGGINYDMLRLMAAHLQRPVRFIPVVSIDRSLRSLRDGGCDIFASLPVTAEMKRDYLFSEGVYTDRQVLIQRRLPDGSLKVNSVLDLAGATIHIEKNSAAKERIENVAREIGADINIASHADLSDEYLFLKVASGDLQFAVINGKMAARMIERHPQVSAQTPVGFTQFQAWLTRHSDTKLMHDIDAWLADFKASDAYTLLLKRYMAADSIPVAMNRDSDI